MARAPQKTPVSRDASKQHTREALIAAALELFAEDGLDAPSLDAICERAGYTRGAFYVHFPDRDALLVAVMEKVGESVLGAVFEHLAEATPEEPGHALEVPLLAEAAHRFVAAIAAGAYPLLPPPKTTKRRKPAGPQIRFHQLLDACARSPIVRERYRGLVEASIEHVATLARADQAKGALADALDPKQVGTILLAVVIGAQTMTELGVPIDPKALTATLLAGLVEQGRHE